MRNLTYIASLATNWSIFQDNFPSHLRASDCFTKKWNWMINIIARAFAETRNPSLQESFFFKTNIMWTWCFLVLSLICLILNWTTRLKIICGNLFKKMEPLLDSMLKKRTSKPCKVILLPTNQNMLDSSDIPAVFCVAGALIWAEMRFWVRT